MGNLYSYFNSSNNENSNDEFMENEIFYNKVKNYKHKIIELNKIVHILNNFYSNSDNVLEYCFDLLKKAHDVLPEFKLEKRNYFKRFKKYYKTTLTKNQIEKLMISESTIFHFDHDISLDIPNNIKMNFYDINLGEYNESFTEVTYKKDYMGITKKFLKLIPSFHKAKLIQLFNNLLLDNSIKDIEKNSIGIGYLIYKISKNGPLDDIKSFRVITTIPNVINHFHRILSIRLSNYFLINNLINTEINKGSIPGIKQPILEQIVKARKICEDTNNHIMFLDISNAFPSVNIIGLIKLLSKYNVDTKLINYIKSYYDRLKYKIYIDKDSSTDFIRWNQGLIQGCPMSPILFIVIMNYIISIADKKYRNLYGAKIYSKNIMFLAYIDDICISCNSAEGLEIVYNELKSLLSQFNLTINKEKTKIMSNNNDYLKDFERVTSFKYLGEIIEFGKSKSTVYKSIFKSLYKKLYRIHKATYNDDVKKYIFNIYVLNWFTKKMLVYYDLEPELKENLFKVIIYFTSKWKFDNSIINLLAGKTVPLVLSYSNDSYIKEIIYNTIFDYKYPNESRNKFFNIIKNLGCDFNYS